MVALPPPGPQLQAAPRRVHADSIPHWGPGFSFTWRVPTTHAKHGSWQATCPYHRKSGVTMCTRTMNVPGPDPSQKDEALRRLMQWCVCAGSFNRKRWHGLEDPRGFRSLPRVVLEERAAAMPAPPAEVLDDDALDRIDAGEDPQSCSGHVARRGRQNRGGRGRGRGPKPSAQEAASEPPAPAEAPEPQAEGRGRGRGHAQRGSSSKGPSRQGQNAGASETSGDGAPGPSARSSSTDSSSSSSSSSSTSSSSAAAATVPANPPPTAQAAQAGVQGSQRSAGSPQRQTSSRPAQAGRGAAARGKANAKGRGGNGKANARKPPASKKHSLVPSSGHSCPSKVDDRSMPDAWLIELLVVCSPCPSHECQIMRMLDVGFKRCTVCKAGFLGFRQGTASADPCSLHLHRLTRGQ